MKVRESCWLDANILSFVVAADRTIHILNEDWRAGAAAVDRLPSCKDRENGVRLFVI